MSSTAISDFVRRLRPPTNKRFAMAIIRQYYLLSLALTLPLVYFVRVQHVGLLILAINLILYALFRYWLRDFYVDDDYISGLLSRRIRLYWPVHIVLLLIIGLVALIVARDAALSYAALHAFGFLIGMSLSVTVSLKSLRRYRRRPATAIPAARWSAAVGRSQST